MWISVRQLYREDRRRPNWEVLESHGVVGWLVLGYDDLRCYRAASLVDAEGRALLPRLINAKIEAVKGKDGMLVEGVHLMARGVKHSRPLRQAWWCHAPPRTLPLRDMTALKRARIAEGAMGEWGEDEDWPYPDDME
ncbi:MAG: hypothetical protein I8H71_01350 [Xanthomonadaceae bacterium]|nr:hypothetical protein [Xanthomonadaceae bacterium]